MIVHRCVGARVGLIGNPSDGFGGKTIAALLEDFHASLMLWESPDLEVIPHPQFDPFCFSSLDHLAQVAEDDGYYGGVRLLYATCKRFHSHCREAGIRLDHRNFTIQYDTNIPRQVGLAGSSAIITAALKSLMDFYGVTDRDIPRELGIQAGLQDRVIQVYGGLVYMDFDPEIMADQGHGHYEKLDLTKLPPLWIAYVPHSTECSGKLHNNMRYRFDASEPQVVAGMRQFARYTDLAREAIEDGDYAALGELMNRNFDLRRQLYGDAALGHHNLEMIEIARAAGLPAKFPGSGGAIVGIYDEPARLAFAAEAFERAGYAVQPVTATEELVPELRTEVAAPRRAVATSAGGFHTAVRNGRYEEVFVAK